MSGELFSINNVRWTDTITEIDESGIADPSPEWQPIEIGHYFQGTPDANYFRHILESEFVACFHTDLGQFQANVLISNSSTNSIHFQTQGGFLVQPEMYEAKINRLFVS